MEDLNEINKMAEYCLNCKTKPCSKGCPLHTNIPEFIQKIKEKNYKEAYNILHENNCFSYICSLVCPQEDQCEGSCVRGIKGEPTQIGKLEEFINKWASDNNFVYDYKNNGNHNKNIDSAANNILKIMSDMNTENGENKKKVAIIGGGPSGLFCAFELLRNGLGVTIYEKEKEAGGVLRYGIPEFRLDKTKVDIVIKLIKNLGCKFKFEAELGKNITIEELNNEFDAIYVAIGAEVPQVYSLTENDEKVKGTFMPDVFLKAYNENRTIENLGDVCVIGGGNVAIDCARCAIKMNAKSVSILYRRDEENMPATYSEIKDAIDDGVKIMYKTRVIGAETETIAEAKENTEAELPNEKANFKTKRISSLKCIKTQIVDKKAIDIENSEFDYKADTVIFAIGLKPNNELLINQNLKLNDWGLLEIDECCKTNIPKVFAGGDVSESKSTVCRALAAGRKAANNIIKELN